LSSLRWKSKSAELITKSVTRWKGKNGIADLEKAKHYIELLIELHKNDQEADAVIEHILSTANPGGTD